MRLEAILQAHRLPDGVAALARPFNDHRTFAGRVRAEIAEAAGAVGLSYSERELTGFAAVAGEAAATLRRKLSEATTP